MAIALASTRPSTEDKPDWANVDPNTLPATILASYNEYREAAKFASEARNAFESAFSSAVKPAKGQRVIYGYRFGKLSIAVVTDDKPASTHKGEQSLTDWLASRRNAGIRT
ncbi:MAG: hypothetical protein P4L50_00065 [Anaerolineaceae bacterium]|nr:hypothetical protein [Anaerolineaceae bacterium]